MGQALCALDDLRQQSGGVGAGAIIASFLRWTVSACAAARAEGADCLARAYLRHDLDPHDREHALLALTSLLDDGSPLVRFALAKVFAASADAPHHIVTALANDRPDIAAIVLAASPALSEAELVDAVALGDTTTQTAIARRYRLPVGVSAALAEVGTLPAGLALCRNSSAHVSPAVLARVVERFGDEADVREAVLARPDLEPGLRHDLVVETARALARFVTERAWMTPDGASRLVREASDQACVTISAQAADRDGIPGACRLVAHLRETGRLTAALILRAVLCGNHPFFEAAMSELSGVPLGRVAGLARGGRNFGFAALYAKAGLPPSLLPAFRAAMANDLPAGSTEREAGATLQRRRIGRVLQACTGSADGDLGKVTALLRRFDAEAAREDARLFAFEVKRDWREGGAPALPRLMREDRGVPLLSAA